jgi:hypothetical protein
VVRAVVVAAVRGEGVVVGDKDEAEEGGDADEEDDEAEEEEEVEDTLGDLALLAAFLRLGAAPFRARRLAERFSLRRTRSNSSL